MLLLNTSDVFGPISAGLLPAVRTPQYKQLTHLGKVTVTPIQISGADPQPIVNAAGDS